MQKEPAYTSYVGTRPRTVYKAGALRGARRKGLAGKAAHPVILPGKPESDTPKPKFDRKTAAIRWMRRIARRGRLAEYFPMHNQE